MDEDKPVEIYTDAFRFTVQPYGVNFTFGLNKPHPDAGKPPDADDTLVLRMSLENAKILAMLLRRNLKGYERTNSIEIALPPQIYTQLGVAREDWG